MNSWEDIYCDLHRGLAEQQRAIALVKAKIECRDLWPGQIQAMLEVFAAMGESNGTVFLQA